MAMVMHEMNEDTRDSVTSARLGSLQAGDGPSHSEEPLPSSRSDLILLLGALSLFCCGPLGILAWIMAQRDLGKIRQGRMSSAKIRSLKVGRALGIIGTTLFCATLAIGVVAVSRGAHQFGRELGFWMGPHPLPADQLVFAGEWYGSKGTIIRIRPNGTGDFWSRHTSMMGGHVTIGKDFISIGLLGFSKTWKIVSKPELANGQWNMRLDGEVFSKRVEGLYVKRASTPVSEELPEMISEDRT
jgi:hypothetical protein